MSLVLPFDIIALIIDIVGENKDTNLLRELALVSHSFLQICSKHLFSTVELHDAVPKHKIASSKKKFLKLLNSRPDVVKFICKLTFKVRDELPNNDDHLLSSILPTFSRLNCLTIDASRSDWNTLDSTLTSAFLHLMHLPTINHIDLSSIQGFPLSSLTASVNLHRLDMLDMRKLFQLDGDRSPEIVVLSEMLPKIREFRSSRSTELTKKLIRAQRQDGQPAFNFIDLRRVSMSITFVDDEPNIRYLLENAKLLEELQLSVVSYWSLVGLHDILSTLKVLDLTVFSVSSVSLWFREELEAMAGCNMLEALSLKICVNDRHTEDVIGSIIQEVGKVLVKPGWSTLRQVHFKVSVSGYTENGRKLFKALHSLPDKYLSHLPKLDIAFHYSVYQGGPGVFES
jgi:hypothetical protein